MIITLSIIIILLVSSIFMAKRILTKNLQVKYERSLLNGDRDEADKRGRIYYLSLDEDNLKAKGIVNIEEKISDDFRAFNH